MIVLTYFTNSLFFPPTDEANNYDGVMARASLHNLGKGRVFQICDFWVRKSEFFCQG